MANKEVNTTIIDGEAKEVDETIEETSEKKGLLAKAVEIKEAHPIATKVVTGAVVLGLGILAVSKGKKIIDGRKAIEVVDTVDAVADAAEVVVETF